jgi:hypothetical protein
MPETLSTLPPSIDYTARDFSTVKAALVQYLRDRYPNDFTDFTESQLGIAILELFAYVAANQNFYLDREANERYFATARQRRNIVLQARNVGYTPYLASAASVNAIVDTTNLVAATNDVFSIARGQKLTSTGGVVFEVTAEHSLTCTNGATKTFSVDGGAPTTTPAIPLSQGESRTFTTRSNGQPFQTFTLEQFPVIDGSITGYVGGNAGDSSAVMWTRVGSLQLGDPADVDNNDIFAVSIDENDKATIKFGDNITGTVPPNDSIICITYRIGGGSVGNIAANTLTGTITSTKNGTTAVALKVSNTSPATGGQDRESASSIKFFAPLWVKTNDRAITEQDYNTLSTGFTDGETGSVAKAGVICDPSDGLSNVVTVYIWTRDSANVLQADATQSLKTALKEYLDSRKVVTVYTSVTDGTLVPIDVTTLIQVDPRFIQDDVVAAVNTRIDDIFKEDRVRYGNELRLSWLTDEIMSVPGVKWCHVSVPAASILTGTAQELASGTLTTQSGMSTTQFKLPTSIASGALAGTTSATDGYYANYRVEFLTGAAAGQTRKITGYTGSSRVCTVSTAWGTQPASGDTFRLWHPRLIALATTSSAVDGAYNRQVLALTSGVGTNQNRAITSYNGTTKIATVDKLWTTAPNSTTGYTLFADLKCARNEALVLGNKSVTVISSTDES